MSNLVRVCIWVLGFLQIGGSRTSLQIMTKLLYYSLCLLNAIVELHVVDEQMFNDFLIGNGSYM